MLSKVSSDEAQSQTELIFSHVLNVSKGQVRFVKEISKKQKKQILAIVKKRQKNIPLQHLLGNVHFLNLELKVNKNVLIPRNETEQLADIVVKDINQNFANKITHVLDMCCGSGCLGLAIAKETKSFVTLADVSKKALKVAKNNAKNNKIENVLFKKSNLFEKIEQKFDVFVSNPPYIKTKDIEALQPEVKNFEPVIALDGGSTGLDFYKKIIADLESFLNNNALIYFEVGINQAQEVKQLLEKFKFKEVEIVKDYYNVERIVKAKFAATKKEPVW